MNVASTNTRDEGDEGKALVLGDLLRSLPDGIWQVYEGNGSRGVVTTTERLLDALSHPLGQSGLFAPCVIRDGWNVYLPGLNGELVLTMTRLGRLGTAEEKAAARRAREAEHGND